MSATSVAEAEACWSPARTSTGKAVHWARTRKTRQELKDEGRQRSENFDRIARWRNYVSEFHHQACHPFKAIEDPGDVIVPGRRLHGYPDWELDIVRKRDERFFQMPYHHGYQRRSSLAPVIVVLPPDTSSDSSSDGSASPDRFSASPELSSSESDHEEQPTIMVTPATGRRSILRSSSLARPTSPPTVNPSIPSGHGSDLYLQKQAVHATEFPLPVSPRSPRRQTVAAAGPSSSFPVSLSPPPAFQSPVVPSASSLPPLDSQEHQSIRQRGRREEPPYAYLPREESIPGYSGESPPQAYMPSPPPLSPRTISPAPALLPGILSPRPNPDPHWATSSQYAMSPPMSIAMMSPPGMLSPVLSEAMSYSGSEERFKSPSWSRIQDPIVQRSVGRGHHSH